MVQGLRDKSDEEDEVDVVVDRRWRGRQRDLRKEHQDQIEDGRPIWPQPPPTSTTPTFELRAFPPALHAGEARSPTRLSPEQRAGRQRRARARPSPRSRQTPGSRGSDRAASRSRWRRAISAGARGQPKAARPPEARRRDLVAEKPNDVEQGERQRRPISSQPPRRPARRAEGARRHQSCAIPPR